MTRTGTTYEQVRSIDFSTLNPQKLTCHYNQLLSPDTFTSGKMSASVL